MTREKSLIELDPARLPPVQPFPVAMDSSERFSRPSWLRPRVPCGNVSHDGALQDECGRIRRQSVGQHVRLFTHILCHDLHVPFDHVCESFCLSSIEQVRQR